MYCFAKLCRLCLAESDNLIDFKTKDCDKMTYKKKVRILMPTLISPSQGFPELICENCRFQLHQTYNFITSCYEKYQLLLRYQFQIDSLRVENMNYCELQIKLENVDSKVDVNKKRTSLLDTVVPTKLFKEYCEDVSNETIDNNTLIVSSDFNEMVAKKHSNKLLEISRENLKIDSDIMIETEYSIKKINENEFFDNNERNEIITTMNSTPNNNDINNISVDNVIETINEDSNDTASTETVCKNSDEHKKWQCEICNYKCTRESNLRKHMDVHNVITYSCSICNQKYNDYKSFDQHRKIHYTSKSEKMKTYIRRRNRNEQSISTKKNLVTEKFQLQQHDDSVDAVLQTKSFEETKEKTHCCRICLKTFHREPNLKRHYESVHLKIRYSCDLCDKTFTQIDSLRHHKKTVHLNIKKFRCHICERKLSSANTLRVHLKNRHNNCEDATNSDFEELNVEQNKKDFEVLFSKEAKIEVNCSETSNESLPVIVKEKDANLTSVNIKEEISNSLDERSNLNSTLDIKIEMSYNCKDNSHISSIENSQEINNTQLEEDESSSQEKTQVNFTDISNSCEICNKAFSTKHSLRRHYESIHLKIRYQCDICNKFFNCVSSLGFHKQTVHLKIKKYKCHVCQQKFTKSRTLSQHLDRHNMKKCTICNRLFANVELLNKHYKAHSITPECIELLNKNSSCYNTFEEENSEIEDEMFEKEETDDVSQVEEINIKSEETLQNFVKEEYLLPD